ncbi:MAG: bifunctional phosphoribosyl-AMP cyclohydrolase/phosphoribosyl-ATP diphosphatase HisIE [Balneolaceae bacterium]|nr:bifunctional phosphoribosyl-AMP cyclohydrolase/phosphoribosyl-ATP diphosphatase HisIE [Balneolaceae bacterium]
MKENALDIEALDFDKGGGLLPAVIQDAGDGRVLMLGYMNREAVRQTLEQELVTFYSRSKERLWTKGESSGNRLRLVDLQADCDRDTLLVLAEPTGPVCHTGEETCFHRKDFDPPASRLAFLTELEALIRSRREERPEDSYTTYLFDKGLDKIAQKVGEEAVETVIEAKNDKKKKFTGEVADLLFHLMVLMQEKDVSLERLVKRLEKRHAKPRHKHHK